MHRLNRYFVPILALSILLVALPSRAEGPEERRLDFLIGDWKIEAHVRRTPVAIIEGSGTMAVSWSDDGKTLLAEMDVQFANFAVQGVTKRRYNPERMIWEISWNPSIEGRQVYPAIEGRFNGDHFVELDWGVDSYGSFIGRLVLSEIAGDRFVVRKDQLYDDGTLLPETWVYEAVRIKTESD